MDKNLFEISVKKFYSASKNSYLCGRMGKMPP